MKKKMLFVYNPKAAIQVVAERTPDFDLVACSGGDGTLGEVVSGMMQNDFATPLGYIPAGSTNDFAESLGLSKNLVNAAQTVVSGKDFACDIGTFNKNVLIIIIIPNNFFYKFGGI